MLYREDETHRVLPGTASPTPRLPNNSLNRQREDTAGDEGEWPYGGNGKEQPPGRQKETGNKTQANTQRPLKMQSVLPISLPTQGISPACQHHVPLEKPHAQLHSRLPGSPPVTSARMKQREPIPNLRTGSDGASATQKGHVACLHQAQQPSNSTLKVFYTHTFAKQMTPLYGMAGLYGKPSEEEDEFELKEASLDRFIRIAQAVHRQYKLLIYLLYQSDGPN